MRPIDADALREIVEDGLRNNPTQRWDVRVCHRTEYTHFLDVIQRMPTIAQPPNDPLTLADLLEMDGEPVWVERSEYSNRWALVHVFAKSTNVIYLTLSNGVVLYPQVELDCDSKIYRRKPEEGDGIGS